MVTAIETVNSAMSMWNQAVTFKKQATERLAESRKWTIHILMRDRIYPDVQQWLLSLPARDEPHTFTLSTTYDRQARYSYDGKAMRWCTFDGHRIGFRVAEAGKDDDATEASPSDSGSYMLRERQLEIVSGSPAAVAAVKAKVQQLLDAKRIVDSPPSIHVHSRWGWDRSQAPLRSLASVVLDRGIKESVSADMGRFLGSESDYVERGLPWHRGYLLHGPPGTGKTSLIKGLAAEHGLDIYYLSVSSMRNDDDLIDRVHDVRPRSVVLLEDIDSATAATDRSDESGVTTSGLLNVLDGMFTPHGMIGVLTTNHRDRLDPAILRPGRIDVQLELGPATTWQVRQLFRAFYDREPADDIRVFDNPNMRPTSADVIEAFKGHLYDADGAEQALRELVLIRAPRVAQR
ncbi:AAA family ATPase [Williamsia herbipolensis]|uniref:AAA family ATPase n=1 Tax=Williamsia herbipolensis TaxID=1603258 RepID=A0AAU4JZZ7_9NOCA|nr:AAA family ATPase [Williamsia herbipolensis]